MTGTSAEELKFLYYFRKVFTKSEVKHRYQF